MALATVTQQPGDVKDYDIDFDQWFPSGDQIVSAVVNASPVMPEAPSAVVSPSARRVKVWVYDGGSDGLTYTLSIKASTTDGRVKEVELIVKIRET
ncbi:hypothetical protein LJR074_001972 [Acidovorax sp. LjRoot74]|uniref:phage fiber-tail adaptor protein n=1 Tax=Acidovorax sp. LjRoot74 TaxID=3342337 RepID=UPI003ED07B79